MIYSETIMNLFHTGDDYVLAHCISKDCAMGAGIALQFRKKFPEMPEYCLSQSPRIGSAVLYNSHRRIFNLITKKLYWQKPTYSNLEMSLNDMKKQSLSLGIKKIAMPTIGAGLDKLQWSKVKEIIHATFADTDIEILVCKLK